jgi:hypothetical protein
LGLKGHLRKRNLRNMDIEGVAEIGFRVKGIDLAGVS